MLLLHFHVADQRYALPAKDVVEIIPAVKLRRLPMAEAYLAGVFNYRGLPLPVVDLRQLFEHQSCGSHLSTRIVVVPLLTANSGSHRIGIMAERVTHASAHDPQEMQDLKVRVEGAPFLGKLGSDEFGTYQLVEVSQLLPDAVVRKLFLESSLEESLATNSA